MADIEWNEGSKTKKRMNQYFYYPKDDNEFKKEVVKNGGWIAHIYENDILIDKIEAKSSKEWKSKISTQIKTSTKNGVDIEQIYENCKIYAVPKGYEDMLPPKETNTHNKPTTEEDSDQNKGENMKTIPPLNQILYGPPGTGKTYNTINKALEILGEKIDGKSRAEIKAKFDEYRQNGQIEFVTFHQSFSYEEFVEGIKPKLTDSSAESSEMSYTIKSGIFKEICKKALEELCRFKEEYANLVKKFYGDILKKLKQEQEFSHKGITFELTQQGNEIQTKGSKGQAVWKDEITKLLMLQNSKNLSDDDIKNSIDIDEGFVPLYKAMRDYFFSEYLKGNPKSYILIIDEINRGNISKILGELITLIEPSKRIGASDEEKARGIGNESLEVTLPYSNETFGVPSNLYIIGTMNTADRSIALLDTALRRRFEFVEMMPDEECLKNMWLVGNDEDYENSSIDEWNANKAKVLYEILIAINNRIEFLLDREHTIGHAFFFEKAIKEDGYFVLSLDSLKEIFAKKIIPLLQEYFYDDYAKIQAVLNDNGMIKPKPKPEFLSKFSDEVNDEKVVYEIEKEWQKWELWQFVKIYNSKATKPQSQDSSESDEDE